MLEPKYVIYDQEEDLSGPPTPELIRKELFFISGTKEEILETIWSLLMKDGEFGGFQFEEDTPELMDKLLNNFS